MKMSNPKKQADDAYLIDTPIDEMIDDGTITFVGESERDRMVSVMRFTRVRNLLLKPGNSYSRDEFRDMLLYLKQFVNITKKE
jgi:hypothetical protein